VPRGEDPQLVMDSVRGLWQAAHGAPPPGLAAVAPAAPDVISELVLLPFDPGSPEAEVIYRRRRAEEAEQALVKAQRQAGEETAQRQGAEKVPWDIGVGKILPLSSALFIGLLLGWFFFDVNTANLIYHSGNRSRTPVVIEGGVWPQSNQAQWRLGPRSRDRASFSFPQSLARHRTVLIGTLQYSSVRCLGSEVAWRVNISGSPPVSGILNSHHSQAHFDEPILKGHPVITVQIDRADSLSCASELTLRIALQTKPVSITH